MNRYQNGILVKIIEAGTSAGGNVYRDHVLAGAERLIGGRACIPCHLGHARPSVQLGRFVGLQYANGALWGQLVGANTAEMVRMHEGALAAGRPGLGVSPPMRRRRRHIRHRRRR